MKKIINKTENLKNSNTVKIKPKKISGGLWSVLVIIGCIGYIGHSVGLFDSMFSSMSSNSEANLNIVDAAGNTTTENLDEHLTNKRTTTSTRQDAPPVLNETSFNQLQNLYLLVDRVQSKEIKSAAELYGLQRINIVNRREQIKEYNLTKEIKKAELEIQTTQSSLNALDNGSKQTKTELEGPNPGNNRIPDQLSEIIEPSQIASFTSKQPGNIAANKSLLTETAPEITKADVRLRMMIQKAEDLTPSLLVTIGKERYRNVIEGQTIQSRFKFVAVNAKTKCAQVIDQDMSEKFNVCVN
jgi:hypothetical protein